MRKEGTTFDGIFQLIKLNSKTIVVLFRFNIREQVALLLALFSKRPSAVDIVLSCSLGMPRKRIWETTIVQVKV